MGSDDRSRLSRMPTRRQPDGCGALWASGDAAWVALGHGAERGTNQTAEYCVVMQALWWLDQCNDVTAGDGVVICVDSLYAINEIEHRRLLACN